MSFEISYPEDQAHASASNLEESRKSLSFHENQLPEGIANIKTSGNLWVIPSIHGEVERLRSIHEELSHLVRLGDKIVYLGNYIGYGQNSAHVVEEILYFRRHILAQPSVVPSDLVYLKGPQEEMLKKLYELQFAPNPSETLLWMLGNGISKTLEAYDLCAHDGLQAANEGVMSLIKWTNLVRRKVKAKPGHCTFFSQLYRAATTKSRINTDLLFLNTGINPSKPLHVQGDNFWWGHPDFEGFTAQYDHFSKIIRGYDPKHRGFESSMHKVTLDNACGFGGSLTCAGIDATGDLFEILEV